MPEPCKELLITDLTVAQPADALCESPAQDRWLIIPYEGSEISGKMLWSPARSNTPDVAIPLPKAGRCRIYIGIYTGGTWPWYFNLVGRLGERSDWLRLHLRLSDQPSFDLMVPENHPEEQRHGYITETYWKTVNLIGQSLVIAPMRKEAYQTTSAFITHIRIVPDDGTETWPASTKKLVAYFDSNFYGHYVDSRADVQSMLSPLKDSDVGTIFWTTCREDTCYYGSKIGNLLPKTPLPGVYPYWMGRDLHRMLERGEDPLSAVCESAHEAGLKVFASYRRMTRRMPPFVFPLHPDAMLVKRPDLWCIDEQGKPLPHLSVAYPDVRRRMIDLLSEQAENYDIDGVHFYFSRGVPFVYFEQPVLDAYKRLFGGDPRGLPPTDQRLGKARAQCFLLLLRELRQALNRVGERKGKRLEIAMHVTNSVRACLYFGIDVEQIARENLLDILLPDKGPFNPPEFDREEPAPESVGEFVRVCHGSTVKIIPCWAANKSIKTMGQMAQAFYRAGAHGLHPGGIFPYDLPWQLQRRLGHEEQLAGLTERISSWERILHFQSVGGMPFDHRTGLATCG